MQNVSDVNFTLAEVKLTEKQHAALELQSLNTKAQQVSRRQNNKCKGSCTRKSSLVFVKYVDFITKLTPYYLSAAENNNIRPQQQVAPKTSNLNAPLMIRELSIKTRRNKEEGV